ncbi:hypothetical protein HK101_001683 [Irineochytrium annulatum]|nr:hypothetical protein HK101_001683 [Irineochytrium annulatum]
MSRNTTRIATAVVVVTTGAAYLLYKYWSTPIGAKTKTTQKDVESCPGGVPFLGHALLALKHFHHFNDFSVDMQEHFEGRTFLFALPRQPLFFVIHNPELIEHVLKTKFHVYEKGPEMRMRFKDVLGHGIFNSDGARWKSQRKTAANIFNVKSFKHFVEKVFADEMSLLTSHLHNASTTSQPIDLQDLFFRFTLDGFAKIAFDKDVGAMHHTEKIPFAVAFDQAQEHLERRFLSPVWDWEEWGPRGWRQARNVKIIRDFGMRIVKERQAQVAAKADEGEGKSDLLSLLMNVKDENGNAPSDEDLCDHVLNFIIAGRDTTAQALSWTFFMLDQNPSALTTLLSEIDTTLGDSLTPTYDQIKSMAYANAVFRETLRLYPSVPKEMKQANADDVLPDGTLVPRGSIVLWAPYGMGRDTRIWGPDAKQFRPERWIEMSKQPSPFDYPVFNAGPRVCLGKSMAELEGVYVMVSVLRRFRCKVLNPEKVTYGNSLTLPIKGGLRVLVSEVA